MVSQPDNKLAIDVPGPRGAEPVRISTSQSGLSPATHFDVMIGDTFTWTADSGRFAADLELTITDSTGRAHAVMFHSSCSYPLEVGDTYGSVQIVGHENSDGCVSGTTSPTVTPPTPPPTPPTPAPTLACCYEAACGRNNNPNCVEDPHCAVEEAIHEVRCCSDVFIGGWMQRGASCPWASSDAWASGCIDGMNHGEAAAHCAAEGARLCTKAELEADCTAYTGCTHDDDLIWTSTPHATSCSTSPPTNPPVQPTPPPTPPPTTRPPTSPPVQPTPLPTPPPTPPTLPPPTSPSVRHTPPPPCRQPHEWHRPLTRTPPIRKPTLILLRFRFASELCKINTPHPTQLRPTAPHPTCLILPCVSSHALTRLSRFLLPFLF